MSKRTTSPAVGQMSLFDYRPDPYWFLDQIDSNALYGHLLSYQQTDEFRAEMIANQDRLAAVPSRSNAYRCQASKKYRERYPELGRRRKAIEIRKVKIKADLHSRQNGQCFYCHCELDDTAQIDHRIAMINGGSDDMSNLALTCAWCNHHKHVKSEDEWRKRVNRVARSA